MPWPTQPPAEIGHRVLLAWKPTREATRAFAEKRAPEYRDR